LGATTGEPRPNSSDWNPLNYSDFLIIKVCNVSQNNGRAIFLWQLGKGSRNIHLGINGIGAVASGRVIDRLLIRGKRPALDTAHFIEGSVSSNAIDPG
jgi:hypothetical protein